MVFFDGSAASKKSDDKDNDSNNEEEDGGCIDTASEERQVRVELRLNQRSGNDQRQPSKLFERNRGNAYS